MSSPCGSPLPNHRQHRQKGRIQLQLLKDGYSSLERLNRRPRVNKCSLEKLFPQRPSPQAVTTTTRSKERSFSLVARSCSGGSSSDEGEGEGLTGSTEFIRNRKDRSTVLVRRFYKNNQKVWRIRWSRDLHLYGIYVLNKCINMMFWTYLLFFMCNAFDNLLQNCKTCWNTSLSIRWPSQCVLEPEPLSRHCHQDTSQRRSGRRLIIAGHGDPARRI